MAGALCVNTVGDDVDDYLLRLLGYFCHPINAFEVDPILVF